MANSRKILLKLNWKVVFFFICIYIVILLQGSICFPDISSNKSCLKRNNKQEVAETTRFFCVEEQGKELKKEKKKKLNFLKKSLCLCHVAVTLLSVKQGFSTVF